MKFPLLFTPYNVNNAHGGQLHDDFAVADDARPFVRRKVHIRQPLLEETLDVLHPLLHRLDARLNRNKLGSLRAVKRIQHHHRIITLRLGISNTFLNERMIGALCDSLLDIRFQELLLR